MERTPAPAWQYDEFKQIGKDYADPAEVQVYDSSHADFRDIAAESDAVLQLLQLQPGQVLVEFGCGTGVLAVRAARQGLRVHAVDVSPAMLDHARARAQRAGAPLQFHHAGFLTYQHAGPPADAIVTSLAFHHLPDFWKGVALHRMAALLRPGGQLYLYDVILQPEQPLQHIAAFVAQQEAAGGHFLREDAEAHFREEHSTYDWILEGLLARAGFEILSRQTHGGIFSAYHCRRP